MDLAKTEKGKRAVDQETLSHGSFRIYGGFRMSVHI